MSDYPVQGEIIRINGASAPFLVISQDYFNASGLIVVCPITKSAAPDALHVPIEIPAMQGYALCENITTVSAASRGYSRIGSIGSSCLLEIIYRVQSIFDHFHHAE